VVLSNGTMLSKHLVQ